MPVITSENRDGWQRIADEASKQRPFPGRRVRIDGGRKYKGKIGTVVRHERSKFDRDAFRYGSDGNLMLREMQGRRGYRIQVRTAFGETFWTEADHAYVFSDEEIRALDAGEE